MDIVVGRVGVTVPHAGTLIVPQIGGVVTEEVLVMAVTGFLNHVPPLANECWEWYAGTDAWRRHPPATPA